jgi:hypothetical protein
MLAWFSEPGKIEKTSAAGSLAMRVLRGTEFVYRFTAGGRSFLRTAELFQRHCFLRPTVDNSRRVEHAQVRCLWFILVRQPWLSRWKRSHPGKIVHRGNSFAGLLCYHVGGVPVWAVRVALRGAFLMLAVSCLSTPKRGCPIKMMLALSFKRGAAELMVKNAPLHLSRA